MRKGYGSGGRNRSLILDREEVISDDVNQNFGCTLLVG
jgi:hypothetical protein